MTKVLGLTGGIASGKSTVAKMFEEANVPLIDTDVISKEVMKKGNEAYYEIIKHFGAEILHSDKEINRKELGKIIFTDDHSRELLNSIIHPKVREIVLAEIRKHRELGTKWIVLDVPLLFETHFDQYTDINIVVFVEEEDQIERLMSRDNISKKYAIDKISSQMTLAEKIKKADFVIDNTHSILETKKAFNHVMQELEVM